MQQGSSMSETRISQRFHSLNTEQVEVLEQVLSEVVPIHGRGNFPTLELRPRDIITAVRARLEKQGIKVRDVRLNGSTASHVLVRDNGTSYKDLDIIFGVELPRQEDFQVIKESVLGCLLDCLPAGVNRERISSSTMKEAYVQKMVKVFNEHDRWSLISLSNNSGKNLELKFVSALRRQFEFSVDSFQIILDRLLESYLQQEAQQVDSSRNLKEENENEKKDSVSLPEPPMAPKTEGLDSCGKDLVGAESTHINQKENMDQTESHGKEPDTDVSRATENSSQSKHSKHEDENKTENLAERSELTEQAQHSEKIEVPVQTSQSNLEKTELPNKEEFHLREELSDRTECSMQTELLEEAEEEQLETPEHSNPECDPTEPVIEQKEHPQPAEHSDPGQTEPPNLAEPSQSEKHSGNQDFSECPSQNQCNDKEGDTRRLCSPVDSASTNAETEAHAHTAEVKTLKVDAEKQLQAKEEEVEGEEEEEEKEEEEKRDTELTDSPAVWGTSPTEGRCTPSTSAFTFPTHPKHNEAPNATQTEDSESTSDTSEHINPPDTQDMLTTPSSLVADSKNPSLPGSKATNRLSQMVVLKHSSPKPPRRMCRKAPPNSNTNPVCETKTVIAPNLEPSPSPKPEMTFDPDVSTASALSLDLNVTPTEDKPEILPEINTDRTINLPHTSNVFANPESTSTTDLAPDQITASEPVSTLAQDPIPSQPSTDHPSQTTETAQKETITEQVSCDKPIQMESSQETPPPSEQSNPPDSLQTLSEAYGRCPHTGDPALHSEAELSEDECEELHIQMVGLERPSSSTSSFHSCLTPPMLSLSPPCLTPPSPSLSPPPCLSPPPRCLASPMLSISPPPTPGLSSPPLSFSPTSSCLSSPPYLTPPMLSLSPPPLCLSPPLLCLTPPGEAEGLLPRVSSELEALAPGTECEGENNQGISLPQPQGEEEQNGVAPPVPQPASPAVTLAQSAPSGPTQPAALPAPVAPEASHSVPEVRTPKASADAPDGCRPRAAVPAVEVLAESMYGDFEAAMDHLRYRLIATRNPEQIRGGGLLKYSNLLVRDYRPASETQIKTLERYMCSRFFIDFPDVQEQQRKILSYLKNHFIGEERSKYQYLMTLRRVVDDSTVCLMGHERRQTLNMITVLALKVLGEQNIIPNTDHVTCFYQPAPYLAEHSAPYMAEPSYCSYYIPQGGSTLLYQPYPLHLHSQTGLV